MKHTNGFRSAFSEALKNYCLHPVALCVWCLIFVSAEPMADWIGLLRDRMQNKDLIYDYYGFRIFESNILLAGMFYLVLGLIAMTMAIRLFRFCHDRTAVNVYYSLGISRSHLFTARWLTGFLTLPLALLPGFILCGIANAAIIGFDIRIVYSCALYWLITTAVALTAFSVTAVTMSASGTTVEGTLYGGCLLCLPFAVRQSILLFSDIFMQGSAADVIVRRWGENGMYLLSVQEYPVVFDFFAPVYEDSLLRGLWVNTTGCVDINGTVTYVADEWTFPDFRYILLWLAVSAVCFFVGKAMFVHRKSENAGLPGTLKILPCLCAWTLSLPVSAYITYCIADYAETRPTDRMLVCILFGIAVLCIVLFYCIPDLICTRSAKKTARHAPFAAAVLAAVMVFTGIGALVMNSRVSYIPETEEIKSVGITLAGGYPFSFFETYISPVMRSDWDDGAYDEESVIINNSMLSFSGTMIDGLTDARSVETVRSAHEELLALNKTREDDRTVMYGDIVVHYVLQNGKEIYRAYDTVDLSVRKLCHSLLGTEEAKECMALDMERSKDCFYSAGVAGTGLTGVSYSMAWSGYTEKLLDALAADIRSGTLPVSITRDEMPLGYLVFNQYREPTADYYLYGKSPTGYDDILFTLNGNYIPAVIDKENGVQTYAASELTDEAYEEGAGMPAEDSMNLTVPVYADMQSTLAVMEEAGMTAWFNDLQKPVQAWTMPTRITDADSCIYTGSSLYLTGRTGMNDNNMLVAAFPENNEVPAEDVLSLWENTVYYADGLSVETIVLFRFEDGTYALGLMHNS